MYVPSGITEFQLKQVSNEEVYLIRYFQVYQVLLNNQQPTIIKNLYPIGKV